MEPPDTTLPIVFESAITPGVVRWSRTFVAAAAVASGADLQRVADMKLVASELAAVVVASQQHGLLRIELADSRGAMVMTVSPWSGRVPTDDGLDPWVIVGSVADEVSESAGVVTVTFGIPETQP